MTKEKDILLDHDYDGIKELDNDLPPWWLYLFYFTIIWGIGYLFYYHVFGIGDSSRVEYLKQMNPGMVITEEMAQSQFGYESPYASPAVMTPLLRKQLARFVGSDVPFERLIAEAKRRASADDLKKLNELFPGEQFSPGGYAPPEPVSSGSASLADIEPQMDEASLAAGKEVWMKNCIACHGVNGEGGIGPNMTDEYWIHGGSMADIVHIINVGVPAKGMIPWAGVLKPDEVTQVSSFILSIQGTNPSGAKEPQGELYTP